PSTSSPGSSSGKANHSSSESSGAAGGSANVFRLMAEMLAPPIDKPGAPGRLADPRLLGMLLPDPGNGPPETRIARSYPWDRPCRGSGCSIPPRGSLVPTPRIAHAGGRDARSYPSDRSFLPLGSLNPTPGIAHAEGRDARSHPWDRPCRGSGCSFRTRERAVPKLGTDSPVAGA